MKVKSLIAALAVIAALGLPQLARADSGTGTGATPSAQVDLDFRIIVPEFLFFRVGAVASTDLIVFDFTTQEGRIGDGVSFAATGGGDAGIGQVNVELLSNGGQTSITENIAGGGTGLVSGANSIAWEEITAITDDGTLAPPQLTNAGGGTTSPALLSGGVTNNTAIWTYSYDNTNVPEAGTYNGTATYDASAP